MIASAGGTGKEELAGYPSHTKQLNSPLRPPRGACVSGAWRLAVCVFRVIIQTAKRQAPRTGGRFGTGVPPVFSSRATCQAGYHLNRRSAPSLFVISTAGRRPKWRDLAANLACLALASKSAGLTESRSGRKTDLGMKPRQWAARCLDSARHDKRGKRFRPGRWGVHRTLGYWTGYWFLPDVLRSSSNNSGGMVSPRLSAWCTSAQALSRSCNSR
jgi:hypothetical protein